jgi:hypothetical protein
MNYSVKVVGFTSGTYCSNVFCLFIDVCYCLMFCVLFVCCLIVVPLPLDENPFAVK